MTLTILKVTIIIPIFLWTERTLESLSKDVFTPRKSSWREHFAFLGGELAHIYVLIVCMRVKTLSKTNLVASKHIKMKHFWLACIVQKLHCFSSSKAELLHTYAALIWQCPPRGHLAGFLKTLSPNGPFPSNSFFRPRYLQSSHYSN